MSDKKMNDSDSFEERWKDAFNGASVPPSDKVWAGIDGALGPQKFRILPFYYRLAAALLLLLLPLSIYLAVFHNNKKGDTIANTGNKELKENFVIGELDNEDLLQKIDSFYNDLSPVRKKKFLLVNKGNLKEALAPLIEAAKVSAYTLDSKAIIALNTELEFIPALYNWEYPFAEGKYQKVPYLRKKKKQKHKPAFFVRLNAGTNFYEPNFRLKQISDYSRNYDFYDAVYSRRPEESSMNLIPLPNVFNETLSLQREESSFSYSAGLGFGVKLFKHWIIQGGVNYHMFKTIATSNLTVSDIERTIEYPLILNTSPKEITQVPTINTVATYDIQNSFEYLSIPIETGVQLNSRKHSLLLKAGISTDVFLRNEIEDTNSKYSKLSVLALDSFSPYRKVSFSGSVGAELGIYQTKYYSLLLEGNYRAALNNITNSNATFNSTPQSVHLGLVFRFSPKNRFK